MSLLCMLMLQLSSLTTSLLDELMECPNDRLLTLWIESF